MEFLWPIDPPYRWISGYKFNPPTHDGEDYGTPTGATLRAMQAGVVKVARFTLPAGTTGQQYGYGNYIQIDHGDGWMTLCAHLLDGYVKAGDTVVAGQIIGHCDHTGWSSGPHLHLKVSHNGTPIKPSSVMKEVIMPPATWVLPAFPQLPQGIVIIDALMVRKKPDKAAVTTHASLKRNQAVLAYDSYTDASGNVWVCIGLDQWACGLYQGQVYIQF